MKKLFFYPMLMGVVLMCLTSCKSTYYQVYSVKGEKCNQGSKWLSYQNEDCKITYDLWSESGAVFFSFENTTDSDIFINMRQSFYICNNRANCYYSGLSHEYKSFQMGSMSGTLTKGLGVGVGLGVGFNGVDLMGDPMHFSASASASAFKAASLTKSISKGNSQSVRIQEQEVVCVPSKSSLVFCKFAINPPVYRDCIKASDSPADSINLRTFQIDNSPIVINNRISYSFDKDLKTQKQFDNVFWLNRVDNYSEKFATKKSKAIVDCEAVEATYFKVAGPNKFYKAYKAKTTYSSSASSSQNDRYSQSFYQYY